VKRHPKDTVSGTVISTFSKYTLQPVAYRLADRSTGERGQLKFTAKPPDSESSDQRREHDGLPPLLSDIAAEELRDCDEFCEGDYIIYRQKLGIIQQVDRDAVLMLPNHTAVTPLNPYALELPLSLGSKPIVSLPNSNSNELFRPVSSGPGGSDLSVPSETLVPGQYVRTTQKNLRRGSWISGNLSIDSPAEGYIVATPPVDVHVDWLCSNIFSVGLPFIGPTSEVIRASTLHGHATTYDSGKIPASSSQQEQIKMRSAFTVGDRVRFRDPAGAAVKYPQFDRIPKEQTFDYDLNVFKVVSVKSEAVVQWQDLNITTEPSTSLHKFLGLENEVWPGELVTLKDEIQTIANPNRNAHEPLAYTFTPTRNQSILLPKKVGIVQTVNSRERIASVRWYKEPRIELLHEGHVLSPSSVLGELGDEITDVSMYELTTHPGLVKSRGEMVLLVPEKVHQSHIPSDTTHPSTTAAGPCLLSYLFPMTFTQANVYLEHIKSVLVKSVWFNRSVAIDTTPLPPRHSVRREDFSLNHPLDWIGHIISLDVDGTITVRLGALRECRDIRVPLEKILMVLDDDITAGGGGGPLDDMDDYYDEWDQVDDDDDEYHFFDRVATVLSRTIEYEGGEPLDTADDDDEMWMTEDEENDDDDEDDDSVIGAPPVLDIQPPEHSESGEDVKVEVPCPDKDEGKAHKDVPTILRGNQVLSCPPSFAILESSPPSDQHFAGTPPSPAAAQRFRRIRKEYQILESSLPPGIFARTWESRMDLLRVVIIGPQGTPYEYAPFLIDLHFNVNFPNAPPDTYFHSWTNGMGRINPNMYEDGKICLSILGTWPPKNPNENWSPAKSTVLQILVSIMGLVLVKDPFYSTLMPGQSMNYH
jgi:ubiquitin-conjugating enzyme E2 O